MAARTVEVVETAAAKTQKENRSSEFASFTSASVIREHCTFNNADSYYLDICF